MKTQIIQLEDHDDTLSVQDKMDWSQTPRVLLVWPESGKVLRERLDLILLERYCSSHGSQLALVTGDPVVIFQAGKAGIPVFQTRREAQLQPWGKSFREFQRQDLQRYIAETPPPESLRREPQPAHRKLSLWARIPIFTAGVLSVLAIAATLLPTAEISIRSDITHQELIVPFQADPEGDEIGISGTVPGRELDVVVDGQLARPATGVTSIPSEYARGQVTFSNLGEESITIPKDTILSTGGEDPVLFRTLSAGQTPSGPGEDITIEVEALYPGERGNLPAGSIQEINLSAGAELIASNPDPTSGGEDLQIPAPSRLDRIRLSSEMNDQLEEQARMQIDSVLGEGDVLLTTRLDEYDILAESYSPLENDPGDTLWLDRSVRYRVYYAAQEDLLALARELVAAQYQDGIIQPDLESIQLQSRTLPLPIQDGRYSWQEQITWQEAPALDPDQIISWSIGKDPAQAARDIQQNLGVNHLPEIDLQPSWWPRIPVLPFRITINEGGSFNGR